MTVTWHSWQIWLTTSRQNRDLSARVTASRQTACPGSQRVPPKVHHLLLVSTLCSLFPSHQMASQRRRVFPTWSLLDKSCNTEQLKNRQHLLLILTLPKDQTSDLRTGFLESTTSGALQRRGNMEGPASSSSSGLERPNWPTFALFNSVSMTFPAVRSLWIILNCSKCAMPGTHYTHWRIKYDSQLTGGNVLAPLLQLTKLRRLPPLVDYFPSASFVFFKVILQRAMLKTLHDNVVRILVIISAVPTTRNFPSINE